MSSTKQLFSEQLHELIAQTTKNLTKVQRTKFETLITIHVHQHDIFEELVRKCILDAPRYRFDTSGRNVSPRPDFLKFIGDFSNEVLFLWHLIPL